MSYFNESTGQLEQDPVAEPANPAYSGDPGSHQQNGRTASFIQQYYTPGQTALGGYTDDSGIFNPNAGLQLSSQHLHDADGNAADYSAELGTWINPETGKPISDAQYNKFVDQSQTDIKNSSGLNGTDMLGILATILIGGGALAGALPGAVGAGAGAAEGAAAGVAGYEPEAAYLAGETGSGGFSAGSSLGTSASTGGTAGGGVDALSSLSQGVAGGASGGAVDSLANSTTGTGSGGLSLSQASNASKAISLANSLIGKKTAAGNTDGTARIPIFHDYTLNREAKGPLSLTQQPASGPTYRSWEDFVQGGN